MNALLIAGTAFIACAVEMVEAVTIVLAVAVAAGRRPATLGTVAAIALLVALVALFGPLLRSGALVRSVELVAGPLLVLIGITWLRKAIWRYAGRKAMRDERAAYDREVTALRANTEQGHAVATAFTGVFIEGLEVVVIVVAFGASRQGSLVWSAAGAAAALVVVAAAAFVLRKPFATVPENAMKFVVGTMLLTIGTFWTGEALGAAWWLGDATLLPLAALFAGTAVSLVTLQKRHAA